MTDDNRTTSRRVTRPRTLIRKTMSQLACFATAQEIATILREQGTKVGTATVYRNLQLMAEDGELDTLHMAGETLYRACTDDRHHHHIVCRRCGRTVEVEIPGLEQWIDRAATRLRFNAVNHELVVFGLCPACAAQGPEDAEDTDGADGADGADRTDAADRTEDATDGAGSGESAGESDAASTPPDDTNTLPSGGTTANR